MEARGRLSPLLAVEVGRQASPVAEGATSWLLRLETADGLRALKVAKAPEHDRLLAEEARCLWLGRAAGLPRLWDLGRLGPSAPLEMAGRVGLLMDWRPGHPPISGGDDASSTALVVARDVGAALAELHALGLAHGDVKPANVLFEGGASARAALVDFGLAQKIGAALPRGATPSFLPPETAEGRGDGRSRDLYALGLTLLKIAAPEQAFAKRELGALPDALRELVSALLAPAPAARPSADWVSRRAAAEVGAAAAGRADERVSAAYLAVRRRELWEAARYDATPILVEGVVLPWLRDALQLGQRIRRVLGATRDGSAPPLRELGELGRRRVLVQLVGPSAVSWPVPAFANDSALCEALLAAVARQPAHALTLASLVSDEVATPAPSVDAVALALRMGAGLANGAELDAAERLVRDGAPSSFAVATARALRLRGESGRSVALLQHVDSPDATLERAETLRRVGDLDAGLAALKNVADDGSPAPWALRARAIRARIHFDAQRFDEAEAELIEAPPGEDVSEVRALLAMHAGELEQAERHARAGLVVATQLESIARLEAVLGYVAHGEGRPETALERFAHSAENAARVGAVLEEATYLTGVAAAAVDAGRATRGLDAAERSALLFEALGKDGAAARAHLARASLFVTLGALPEAEEAAAEALQRARDAGDDACRAYAHLCLADLHAGTPMEAEHAERARGLLASPSPDDALRIAARCLRAGLLDADETARRDEQARGGERALDARLDWWGARAAVEGASASPRRADVIISELSALVASAAPVAAAGRAAAYAARLAARTSDGERMRRFVQAARQARDTLRRHAPAQLALRVDAAPWWQVLPPVPEAALAPEQIADIDNLVRALADRRHLRSLLDQVLDALVLWTGVERGLLLLKAPGGRLVPRAARNLQRSDLIGEQLELSHTLSERALAQGEPVVAVDAAGELSDIHHSVHALKLRSVLAVPLIARGEPLGVVYLDDRVRRGAFGARELAWVRLVATVASVAIADARDQLVLKRTARRARRAEERLASRLARREAELEVAERELSSQGARAHPTILGESVALRQLLDLTRRVARSDVPVLIVGESGSGKELVARAIHDESGRRGAVFVTENCGAIPEPLLEATLFGHVKGAFTGAVRARAGLFEVADGGTLFLDEIGEMSLGMQTKLLRVLEAGEIRPVGGERTRQVNVRIIGATHRDLQELVQAGSFREDLLFRLDVVSLRVPPLRERRDDIPLLARHFVSKHSDRPVTISTEAIELLCAYDWPGNVRQLENEIRRALVFAEGNVQPSHLSEGVRQSDGKSAAQHFDLKARVDELTRDLVLEALAQTQDNQTKAAELLGISRFGLSKMLRRLELDGERQTLPEPVARVSRAPRRHGRSDASSSIQHRRTPRQGR
ncbi:MAG: sigma 54-interacting transcriptional regulator [Polyangiaceae bacterium]